MTQWNHNIQYHDVLLRAVPSPCQRALDVGCGTGSFARQLAHKSQQVIAIDADHETLERARSSKTEETRVTFVEGDILTFPLNESSFDFISVIATLHHLPLGPALARFRDLLKPGGILGVVGLYRPRMFRDFALAAIALPTSWIMHHRNDYAEVEAPLQQPDETLRDIRNACDATLPGCTIRRHLLFRYSLLWRKP